MIALSDIDERLKEADIIISSTASPLPIIGKGMVERALKARNQPMLLVDIAVPRDVEPEVGKLANAYLYSVDDLQNIIQHNLAQRKGCRGAGGIDRRAGNQRIYGLAARRAPARPFANTVLSLSRSVRS